MSLCRCTWCPCVDALYVLSDEEPDSRGIPCPNSTETNLPHQKLKFILDKNAAVPSETKIYISCPSILHNIPACLKQHPCYTKMNSVGEIIWLTITAHQAWLTTAAAAAAWGKTSTHLRQTAQVWKSLEKLEPTGKSMSKPSLWHYCLQLSLTYNKPDYNFCDCSAKL